MLSRVEDLPFLKKSNNNSYDILSQTSFSAGDVLLLDLDESLLFCKKDEKYTTMPLLAHPKLPALLNTLQSQGVICIGLTARVPSRIETTEQQLANLGLSFHLAQKLFANTSFQEAGFTYQNGVFYSPSSQQDGKKISSKGEAAVSVLRALKAVDKQTFEQNGLNQSRLGRRIIALDDLLMNLEAIAQSLLHHKDSLGIHSIETCLVRPKPIFVSNNQDHTVFPEDLSKLSFLRHMGGGSGGVYIMQDAQGNQYTFKAHRDLNHLQEELVSDALYQAAGCAVPDFAIVSEIPACLEKENLPRNGVYRLAKFITANKEQDPSFIKKELAKHFLVDALLANWDIAVDNFKNVILDKHNTVYRIDNGGGLRYKATNGLKQQDLNWSAHHVDELNSLRDPKMNPDAAEIYNALTQKELLEQHQELLTHANAIFATLSQLSEVLHIDKMDELQAFIAARLYDLEIRLHTSPHPYAKAFESVRADEKHNSASILMTSEVKGIPCVLLGKRIRHEWYSDCGGKSERADGNLFNTASREVFEETAGQMKVSPARLEQCPSHDFITETGSMTHRMFIAEQNYVPGETILEAVKHDASHTQEYTHFDWVPIQAIRAAIQNNTTIHEEGVDTLQVHYTAPETGQEKTISLFPPIANMLQQEPIKSALQQREQKIPVSCKRTRSHAQEGYHYFTHMPPKIYQDSVDEQKHQEARLSVRLMAYGNKFVTETVYPDPEAEHKNLIKTVVATAPLNQEMKRKKTELNEVRQQTKSKSGLVTTTELKPQGIQRSRKRKEHVTEVNQQTVHEHNEFKSELVATVQLTPGIQRKRKEPSAEKKQQTVSEQNESKFEFNNSTQTIAHLQGELKCHEKNPEKLIPTFFKTKMKSSAMAKDTAFQAKLIDVMKAESEYPHRVVLYHATNSQIGYFYDFISMLRSVLVLEDIRSLRAFDEIFAGIEDIEAFLVEQCQKQGLSNRQKIDNYRADYQEKGLSCNFSLFGNYNNSSSSSIDYLYNNKSATNNTKTALVNGITMVLGRLNIKSVSAKELIDLYDQYENDLAGHLYQIFIEEDKVDKLCYFSAAGGHYHHFEKPWQKGMKPEEQHKLVPVIKALKENPQDFLNNEVLSKQESLQARLYMHPRFMHDTQSVTIKAHKTKENPPLLQNMLTVLVQRIAQELLQKKQRVHVCYQGSTQGQAELTSLQRKYAYVVQGETKQNISYGQAFNIELLYQHLDSGNAQGFEQALKDMPNGIDLTQKLINFAGNIKEPLLYYAIHKNQIKMVKILLESKHCTPKFLMDADETGETILFWAARYGYADAIKILLESTHCTAELVRHIDDSGRTSLIAAAMRGCADVVTTLLRSTYCTPEFVSQADEFGRTALLWAAICGEAHVVKTILESKQCTSELLMHADKKGNTALMFAMQNGDINIVKSILRSQYCTPEFLMRTDKKGHTALTLAAMRGHAEIVKILLESKFCTADFLLQHEDKYDHNILTWAVIQGHAGLVNTLLQSADCKPESLNHAVDGYTLLTWAVLHGHTEVVKTLLESKQCTPEFLMHIDKNNDTALTLAAKNGHADIVKTLIENEYCTPELLMHADEKGHTALNLAVKNGNTLMVNTLLKSKHCSPELLMRVDENGDTILILAAKNGNADLVKKLMESEHCTPELLIHADKKGHTALTSAAENGYANIVKTLLESKQCTSKFLRHTDRQGLDALSYAVMRGHTDVVKTVLKNKHCTLEILMSTNEFGNTSLALAAINGRTNVVKVLLESEYCTPELLMHADKRGQTALTYAAMEKRTDDITNLLRESKFCTPEFLLQYATNKNDYYKALTWAVILGYADVVKTLLENKQCTSELLMHADVNGYTLLLWAVKKGHAAVVKTLLESPCFKSELLMPAITTRYTPLTLAAQQGHAGVVKTLLESEHFKPELLKQKMDSYTPLILAARNGHAEVIKVLLESTHFQPELLMSTDWMGRTALIFAAMDGHLNVVKTLLENKNHFKQENMIYTDYDDYTALILAAQNGHSDVVKALLDSEYCTPEYLMQADKRGSSALNWAVMKGHADIAKLLTEKVCFSRPKRKAGFFEGSQSNESVKAMKQATIEREGMTLF